mmetsp:Transcript_16773/g.18660  ORF Transcript_16773/g.18660 Transcript_16773/m.18660 type:complete len:114 (+) Transcript_16773:32-373(+)|eukprot:CAMPEP_0205808420 /NCGR_PEP_ID=MMETSP0205-20121125/12358_1 /ASSEMBLY_ACC=CAM_ASM_000278 /TAXON_ID=36767 /ORGANISM="Euplotes focardii, Strain TN1" /LENGTH=113 /DNA_ID=CAMNT_0053084049 /DNA_START=21 /DNA_END=362 /DNA_ORIENTATION=+
MSSDELNEVYTPILRSSLSESSGKNILFVGKVKSNDGKNLILTDNNENEVTVEDFNGDTNVTGYVEVRGVGSSSSSLEFRALTQFNAEFNLDQYEEMMKLGHTMHKSSLMATE